MTDHTYKTDMQTIDDLKIVCLSLTGKVGKSTVVNNILSPRMPTAIIYRLETINESGLTDAEVVKMKGRDFVQLQNKLAKVTSAIVDVGVTNIESFLIALGQQHDAQMDFDYFVIPVEATDTKHLEMDEFINLVTLLHDFGVEPARIKVIFNKLVVDDDLEYQMRKAINFHRIKGYFDLNMRAYVHVSPAFAALGEINKSFSSMLDDKTNYRGEFKKTPVENEDRRMELTKLMRAQGSVKSVQAQFNIVFNALFGA